MNVKEPASGVKSTMYLEKFAKLLTKRFTRNMTDLLVIPCQSSLTPIGLSNQAGKGASRTGFVLKRYYH